MEQQISRQYSGPGRALRRKEGSAYRSMCQAVDSKNLLAVIF
jgi:hypothetical protein